MHLQKFILKVILMFIEVCYLVAIYVLHEPNVLGVPSTLATPFRSAPLHVPE